VKTTVIALRQRRPEPEERRQDRFEIGDTHSVIEGGPDVSAYFSEGKLRLRGPKIDIEYDRVTHFTLEHVEI